MAASVGITLTATAISFGNDWVQTNTPNFRILMAGGFLTLFFAGIEKLDQRAGVGLASLMLITVLLTPMHGKSPSETVLDLTKGKK